MKRILYFTDAPYFGGAEKYLELLIAALPKDRFEPHVLTVSGARLGDFPKRLAGSGAITHEMKLNGPGSASGYVEFAKIVRKVKPQLLHVNLAGTYDALASLVAPVSWLSGCRCVVTTEHLAMVEGTWKRRCAKRLGGFFIKAVISISQSNVEYLNRGNNIPLSRIVVIHNGVNIADLDRATPSQTRAKLGLKDSTFIFAIVGSLVERKGHAYLLDALARLRLSGGPESALLIVGEGEEKDALLRKCSDLGLSGSVFFLGHRDDVQGIMLDMDCLVVPSTMEGMPFVILEAMVASKSVIASKIYGIPEVILEGESGLLVPPRDVESLCAALSRLASSPGLSREMGSAGRRRAETHFSVERMAGEVEHVYEAVLSGSGLSGKRSPTA